MLMQVGTDLHLSQLESILDVVQSDHGMLSMLLHLATLQQLLQQRPCPHPSNLLSTSNAVIPACEHVMCQHTACSCLECVGSDDSGLRCDSTCRSVGARCTGQTGFPGQVQHPRQLPSPCCMDAIPCSRVNTTPMPMQACEQPFSAAGVTKAASLPGGAGHPCTGPACTSAGANVVWPASVRAVPAGASCPWPASLESSASADHQEPLCIAPYW